MAMLGDEKYNRAQRAKTVGFTDAAISDYNATTAANTAAVQDRNSKMLRSYNTAMDFNGLTPIKDAAKSGYDAVTGAKGAADAANTANAAANTSSAANTVEALRTGGEVASNLGAATTGAGAGAGAATGAATGASAARCRRCRCRRCRYWCRYWCRCHWRCRSRWWCWRCTSGYGASWLDFSRASRR